MGGPGGPGAEDRVVRQRPFPGLQQGGGGGGGGEGAGGGGEGLAMGGTSDTSEASVRKVLKKLRMCQDFPTPNGCRYGDTCGFSHGRDEQAK